MSVDSPNLGGLDAWAFEPRKVEKPWGYELIWAESEQYVGKVLFVKAGESLSLQFHRVTALEDTTILEVSTPHLDDVVRLEDRYGRQGTSQA